MKKILVIGSTGQIGSELTRENAMATEMSWQATSQVLSPQVS